LSEGLKGNKPVAKTTGFNLKKMQIKLFDNDIKYKITEDLFLAYFECRKNKRNTINALAFEKHFEQNLFQLEEEILSGVYMPKPSIAFIVKNPVQREIFAANFKDRVVHHFLINKLNPLFENLFIKDSYACRISKGTHYGVKQIDKFIKICSNNYTQNCYVLKLDIQGFFMHIDRNLLFNKLLIFIQQNYNQPDIDLVIELCKKIIFNSPTNNCIIKGDKKDWAGLPKNKSLFHSPPNCGLPIGNLTSQVFANFYLNTFDQFIKKELDIKYYGRYVDDFIIIHDNKEYLKFLQPIITDFLKVKLELTLHPKKVYLQHYSKGLKFLGTVIKPNRIYIANRTKGNFYNKIKNQNIIKGQISNSQKKYFLSCMNSYLGLMQHYKTYKLRTKIIFKNLAPQWYNFFYLNRLHSKFI